MKPRRRIALLMDIRTAYDHGVARGILRYAREVGNWRLFGQGWTLAQVRDPKTWNGDGIITRVHDPDEVPALLAPGVPVVDVCRTTPHPRIHSAANDDEATGRLAGEHFLAAGHRRFAYCGAPEGTWSTRRMQGFAQAIGVSAARLLSFQRPRSWWHKPGPAPSALKQWVRSLERPIAILAGDDAIGVKLTLACADLGLRVPDEVAMVGVDNEEVLCELASPALSSIPCDTERMGYEAARLLDDLIKHGAKTAKRESRHVAVPPLPVVVRGTSDRFATNDEAVLAALHLIHQSDHAIHVPQVVAVSGLSRRALEMRFRKELDRTILDEIRRTRLERACRLLLSTDLPVAKIAAMLGFSSPQRFHSVFKAKFGMPVGNFRERNRHVP
jgi:LacI family transcriptional regulator